MTMEAPTGAVVGLSRTASPLGTTRFARSEPIAGAEATPQIPAYDLITVVWDALENSLSLLTILGRTAGGINGWLWIEKSAPGYGLPLVILNEEDSGSPTIWGYDKVATEIRSIRLDVFAENSGSPTVGELSLALRTALIDEAPQLEWASGIVVDRSIRGADPSRIEAFKGYDGRMIQGRRDILDFQIQFHPRG